jgi:hypothetical protein
VLLAQVQVSIADLQEAHMRLLAGGCRHHIVVGAHLTHQAGALAAANLVDVAVSQDDEQPGPQVGAGCPAVDLADRARKALLDQIVGAVGFAREVARIATQPGNFGLDEIDRPLHMPSLARAVVAAAADTYPT